MSTARTNRTSTLPAAPGSSTARRARTLVAGVVIAGGLLGATLLTACGDDAADATNSTDHHTTTVVETPLSTARPVVVTATDYHFSGLPERVPAGTQIRLVNDSNVELHELVAIRVPDGDTRPVEELLGDPALASMAPATVLLASPGAEEIQAVGDGTLAEPGRYVVICAIPTGISPEEYMAAVAAAGGQKPEIPNAGEPHLAHGMFAELVVE